MEIAGGTELGCGQTPWSPPYACAHKERNTMLLTVGSRGHVWHSSLVAQSLTEDAKAKRETSTKYGVMHMIDCMWSMAPSTHTDTSELNHSTKACPGLSSSCSQALELTPRLLLQLGQLLQVPLHCWPGPVGVSPYSVTTSSCILTVHRQQPASSSTHSGRDQEPWLLPPSPQGP